LGHLLPTEFEDVGVFESLRGGAAVQVPVDRLPLLDVEP